MEGTNNVDDLWNETENLVKIVAIEVLGFEEKRNKEKMV